MSVTPIIDGLERSEARGAEAQAVARLGFMEWIFGHPGAVTARVVRDALAEPAVQNAGSAAARAFVEVLQEAQQSACITPVRRGRAARLVH